MCDMKIKLLPIEQARLLNGMWRMMNGMFDNDESALINGIPRELFGEWVEVSGCIGGYFYSKDGFIIKPIFVERLIG